MMSAGLADRILAHVRTPGSPTGSAQPLFSMPSVSPDSMFLPRLNSSNRVVRTRMPGGVGGVAPRGVLLSRSIPFIDSTFQNRALAPLSWLLKRCGHRPVATPEFAGVG